LELLLEEWAGKALGEGFFWGEKGHTFLDYGTIVTLN